MEYSSSKPLALQVYKTPAEFKAHRLNRSEQCRLKSAHCTLSKEAQHMEKDFKMTKARLETRFMRRFSVHYPPPKGAGVTPAPMGGGSWTDERRVSYSARLSVDFSQRRGSETSSRRRSIPHSMTRGRLQQPRQTVGVAASAHTVRGSASALPRSRSYARGSLSVASGECGFCEQVSQLMDEYGKRPETANSQSPAVHFDLPEVKAAPSAQDDNREDPVCDNGLAEGKQDQAASESKTALRRASRAATTNGQGNGELSGGRNTVKMQTRIKARRTFYPRRDSIPTSVRYADVSNNDPEKDDTDGPCEGATTTDSVTHTAEAADLSKPVLTSPSEGATVPVSPEDVNLSLTRTVHSPRPASSVIKYPPHTIEHSEVTLKDYEDMIVDHMQHCPAAGVSRSRKQSVAFADSRVSPVPSLYSRRQSASVAQFPLQSKISNFLDQQQEFNKRFPLTRHEVNSLQCARPDLLHRNRKQEEQERHNKKRKAGMIEVMSKLRLA